MELIRPVKMTLDMIVSTTAVNDEQEWASGDTYSKGERRIYHGNRGPSVYQSATDDNKGNQPDNSPDDWVRVGPTNAWAPFDGSASTISNSEDGFEMTLQINEMFDTLAFFEVYGNEIQIRVTLDYNDDEEVFNETINLQDDTLIVDWYAYFLGDFDFLRDGVVQNIPPYGEGATIHIKVMGVGFTGLGELVLGTVVEIGETEHGASHGIRDYSRVKEDDFGNVNMQRGGWSKKGGMQVFVDKSRHRYASRVLTELRSIPTVFIGSNDPDYEPLIIFGFIKDWSGSIPYPTKTLINIEIQGLK